MGRTRLANAKRAVRIVSLRQAVVEVHGQVLDTIAVMRCLCDKPDANRRELTEAARDRLRRAENMLEAIRSSMPKQPTPDSELPFDVPEWPFAVAW